MKALGSVSEPKWREDGAGKNSETRIEDENEKDWFLEGFLVGYRKEKDRREKDRKQRIKAVEEERKKKEIDSEKIVMEWGREEREKFENRMMEELNGMKKTLETVKEEAMKLRLEVKELRKEVEEEKLANEIVEATNGRRKMQEVNGPQVRENVMEKELKDVTLARHNTQYNQDNTQNNTGYRIEKMIITVK